MTSITLLHKFYNLYFKKQSANIEHICTNVTTRKEDANTIVLEFIIQKVSQIFFVNSKAIAKIMVVKRFAVALQAVSLRKLVLDHLFKKLLIFFKHFRWYYLPTTMYKVLIYEEKSIERFIFLIKTFLEKCKKRFDYSFLSL